MKSAEKVIIGIAVGLAVGASLGILFAPDKGTRTRRKIKREYDTYVDKIQDTIEDLKMREKELVANARQAIENKMHRN